MKIADPAGVNGTLKSGESKKNLMSLNSCLTGSQTLINVFTAATNFAKGASFLTMIIILLVRSQASSLNAQS